MLSWVIGLVLTDAPLRGRQGVLREPPRWICSARILRIWPCVWAHESVLYVVLAFHLARMLYNLSGSALLDMIRSLMPSYLQSLWRLGPGPWLCMGTLRHWVGIYRQSNLLQLQRSPLTLRRPCWCSLGSVRRRVMLSNSQAVGKVSPRCHANLAPVAWTTFAGTVTLPFQYLS